MPTEPITIVTYDWVPEFPRGFVRDIRVRWAAKEAGIPYRIETVPLREKSAAHKAMQPFAQVPVVRDGGIEIFESGAILWHLGEQSDALLPREQAWRAETIQWLIAALNSVEPFTMGWLIAKVFQQDEARAAEDAILMNQRLAGLQAALDGHDFIAAGRFTIADIMMSDVLRVIAAQSALDTFPGLAAYVERMTARPAFAAALDEQMKHWAATDAKEKAL